MKGRWGSKDNVTMTLSGDMFESWLTTYIFVQDCNTYILVFFTEILFLFDCLLRVIHVLFYTKHFGQLLPGCFLMFYSIQPQVAYSQQLVIRYSASA